MMKKVVTGLGGISCWTGWGELSSGRSGGVLA